MMQTCASKRIVGRSGDDDDNFLNVEHGNAASILGTFPDDNNVEYSMGCTWQTNACVHFDFFFSYNQ